MFSALAFTLLNLWGKYPPELPSVNLDIDWIYRKVGRGFLGFGAYFWNGLNDLSHAILVDGITHRVCTFAKSGQVHTVGLISSVFDSFGFSNATGSKSRQILKRRARLGLYPIGFTALLALLLLLAFLFASAKG